METTTVMLLISAGEKALFSCATDANIPGLTATWLKDNKPVGDALADRVKVREEHSLQKGMRETKLPRQDSVRNWDGCWVKFSFKMEVELTRLATTFTSWYAVGHSVLLPQPHADGRV